MSTSHSDTIYLRLEGPLQAWGDNSKFIIRRTAEAPTKSGVLGLICCAMGLSRQAARERLPELNRLRMGVRIDRPGQRWWDYHTVGAKYGVLSAEGKIKATASTGEHEMLVSRREYLCDASFLVALQGDAQLVGEVRKALEKPVWPVFLGRKSCPPSAPLIDAADRRGQPIHDDLLAALQAVPWRPRLEQVDGDRPSDSLTCIIEWRASKLEPSAPAEAEVWYDAPVSFDPPVHQARLVVRATVPATPGDATQRPTPPLPRPRADYTDSQYRAVRERRIKADNHLCVFCKSPGPRMTTQHITYRHSPGGETVNDLRSLCGLCHDAVTMIEYGLNMGLDRIDPQEPRWRQRIIDKRAEIIRFRSLETRRRFLSAEEVQ
jgi:CRISPR system Cascade subunit CasD